jgi:hypothetical protein
MMPASFVYGHVTLDFAFEGRPARVTVKYRYYAQEKRVEYESVQCTDKKLRQKIEDDPAMREKINGYVAKVLEKRNEGLS